MRRRRGEIMKSRLVRPREEEELYEAVAWECGRNEESKKTTGYVIMWLKDGSRRHGAGKNGMSSL